MKWTKEYHGYESIMDFDEDWLDTALPAVVPNGEFEGSVKITFEYMPEGEEAPADDIAILRAQLAEAREANARLAKRLVWIRENPKDSVALRFALEANDEEIDEITNEVITA